jgi:hypothetical protein
MISSTNKTDRHDITELLLKVALNTIAIIPNINDLHTLIKIRGLLYFFVIMSCNLSFIFDRPIICKTVR